MKFPSKTIYSLAALCSLNLLAQTSDLQLMKADFESTLKTENYKDFLNAELMEGDTLQNLLTIQEEGIAKFSYKRVTKDLAKTTIKQLFSKISEKPRLCDGLIELPYQPKDKNQTQQDAKKSEAQFHLKNCKTAVSVMLGKAEAMANSGIIMEKESTDGSKEVTIMVESVFNPNSYMKYSFEI